jgi:FKBP-type peptidyl-prolyl cis-trans isomerase FkpA
MKLSLFGHGIALAITMSVAFPMSQAFAQETATSAANAAPIAPIAPSLQQIDVKIGTGKEAIAGSNVSVHYSGWLFDANAAKQHGAAFDSSVGRGPFSFPLGAGRVIKGWDQGVAGMKVGGKRTLIIPAELGYGARGAGGVIPPNATLIFDVELLDVK